MFGCQMLLILKIHICKFHFFVGHGGGWGYSGHSIEAIRFMADTDILLAGFGLFGGRGEYAGKIKVKLLFCVCFAFEIMLVIDKYATHYQKLYYLHVQKMLC